MNEKGWKQKGKSFGVGILLLAVVVCCCISFQRGRQTAQKQGEKQYGISIFFKRQMEKAYFQIPAFLEEGESNIDESERIVDCMLGEFPIFRYAKQEINAEPDQEDGSMAELLLEREGIDEDYKNIEEENLDYDKDALHIESSVLTEMERENSLYSAEEMNEEGELSAQGETGLGGTDEDFVQNFQQAAYPAYTYDWKENWDYEALLSNFFAVDSSTLLDEEYLSLNKLLYEDLSVDKEVDGPQILIYHTHASESFIDSVEGDTSTTIVGAGEKLAHLLQEEYGFRVLHHTGVYDEVREDAYANALPEIEKILEENPTIEIVIDLHRDAVSGDRKLVMDLQGRPTARFMFFNGLSYIRKSGSIEYLENPYIQDNLAFSFQAQVAANEYYPGIARKIYLKAYRYNLHLKPKSMLIELGAQNNTVEEIMNACDPLAHILAIVLDGVVS